MTSGRWVALDTDSQDLITVHTDGKEQHDIIRYSPGTTLGYKHDHFRVSILSAPCILKKKVILPTFEYVLHVSGHYNACKSVDLDQTIPCHVLKSLQLMNKMSAKILNFVIRMK